MDRIRRPADIARKSASRIGASRIGGGQRGVSARFDGGFRRETFALERAAARAKAREMFERFPKAAYMTEIESWRELADGRIEFTMRRLPTAD